ncbi:MAG: TraR/DksA C4-type zinc finger protein [Dehalococcoidales bacterium]|nr:TraR/DksA C4-type zinc finger protein [Dehalococcoidales bacterium]
MAIDLKMIRSRLENEHKRLLEVLEQTQAGATSTDDRREGSPFGKREEEATQSYELEKRLALEKQIKDNLADVERALDKFNKGTYGRCDICGKPIDPNRLEALPYATVCMNCKAKNNKSKPLAP